MIVVMNVVEVDPENVPTFEERFLTRERLLNGAEGFAGFELLKRDIADGAEFSVMTHWESQDAFQGWVKSDLFKRAHARDRADGSVARSSELRVFEVLDAEVPA
jgi:heme oxygenase (mycobilin-producing)